MKKSLTPTEEKIIELMKQELSYDEVGHKLGIAKGTVATHMRNILTKLGLRSRWQL